MIGGFRQTEPRRAGRELFCSNLLIASSTGSAVVGFGFRFGFGSFGDFEFKIEIPGWKYPSPVVLIGAGPTIGEAMNQPVDQQRMKDQLPMLNVETDPAVIIQGMSGAEVIHGEKT